MGATATEETRIIRIITAVAGEGASPITPVGRKVMGMRSSVH
jgi:hypothetical protein